MVYDILDKIKSILDANDQINTVTYGDIFEVDLNKQSIYPLAHIMLGNATLTDHIIEHTVTVLCMDIVDVSKADQRDEAEPFYGIDNEQDVLNTQLYVMNDLIQNLKKGDPHLDAFHLVGDPTCEPFSDRFENTLAGWGVDLTIQTKNPVKIA
jgi:hypothetical protein